MRLRTQLLLINFISIMVMLVALLVSDWKMLLEPSKTWILAGIDVGAGILSSIAFALMTAPITKSMHNLVDFSDRVAALSFGAKIKSNGGPAEVRHLEHALGAMGARLADSFEKLENMERTRRELVANVSHDLRTPLTSIQSYVEALEDKVVTSPAEMEKYLHTIHVEALRLRRLIDDLLELSKLEAGQETLHRVPTHLDQILAEILDAHHILLQEKELSVSVHVPESLPSISLSPEKIHRVIANLLQNAILHSPRQGQIEVSVVGTTIEGQPAVEVSISDHGTGVAPKDKERLFERFYRADQSRTRNTGGAGLGLSIARWLVSLHGGDIGVRDREDGESGAVFWFTLPEEATVAEGMTSGLMN